LAAASNTCRIDHSTFIGNGSGISQSAPNNVKTFGDNNIVDTITGGGLLAPQQYRDISWCVLRPLA
jgi:hypothetical protein